MQNIQELSEETARSTIQFIEINAIYRLKEQQWGIKGSRVMGLVGNDVYFDGEYNYIPSFKLISQVILKLWVNCIFWLMQNVSEKGA
jgi:hypothetical protein